jgi:hypothetical protein
MTYDIPTFNYNMQRIIIMSRLGLLVLFQDKYFNENINRLHCLSFIGLFFRKIDPLLHGLINYIGNI